MLEFFTQFPFYSLLVIVLICWLGIFWYLAMLGRKVTEVEKRLL